ncbi:aspartic proteinase PCS1-like [Ipomoea triloba]|uniref:aspartic proteinase PCS1-like n=1 Tax=Ipomoea triloba TaxID=35885 RepID=UPI00125E9BF0|nr:aspartic proteinase PCS1-like [Ipomoea triloba]
MASATSNFFLFCLIIFCNFLGTLTAREIRSNNNTNSFPLTSTSLSRGGYRRLGDVAAGTTSFNYKSSFKYSMALVVTLPIGTPAQAQAMVLDTGSQLSWIQCHKKAPPAKAPPTTSFDPSLSSSFSVLPCNHPVCKPRIPDFTLPTTCDQKQLCHYSYFYADGTYAEGNLVREKVSFSDSQTTPPLVLGCATESGQAEGILGMNRGRLSFASQAKVQRFSYCVPVRQGDHAIKPTGTFYLGQNPNSGTFHYINMLTFSRSQRMPNLDPLAYTVALSAIKIGGKKLNIPPAVFRPDAGGSGQTMIDSGTEYTFLVETAYNAIREEVVRLAGAKMKKGYVYGGSLDMCFDGNNPAEIGNLIGDMAFEFDDGAEILIGKDRILDGVGRGVHCLGIGRSESLGVASNIIGNFHQQNLWVEFDLVGQRVGFGKADCSRA